MPAISIHADNLSVWVGVDIFLNGQNCGKVGGKNKLELVVDPGMHSIQAIAGDKRSAPVAFRIGDREMIGFVCSASGLMDKEVVLRQDFHKFPRDRFGKSGQFIESIVTTESMTEADVDEDELESGASIEASLEASMYMPANGVTLMESSGSDHMLPAPYSGGREITTTAKEEIMTTETKSRAFADQDALLSTTKGIAGLVDAMFVIDEAHVADKVKERAMYGVCNAIRSEIGALTEAVELKHVVVA